MNGRIPFWIWGLWRRAIISDKLKEYLKAAGVESALINLGGNVMTVGSKPDGSPWTVGHPETLRAPGNL